MSGQYRKTYLQLGQQELWSKNYVEAINYLTYYIKDHPNMYEGYYFRTFAKYELGDLLGAEQDITKAIICLPNYSRLYLMRGGIRSENFKYKTALSDLHKSIALDSSLLEAYFQRAIIYLNMSQLDSALLDADHVIAADTNHHDIYALRGTVHLYQQNYEQAVNDFTIGIRLDPKNGRAFVNRGRAYAEMKSTEKAMNDFEMALKIDSLDGYAFFHRALAQMNALRYEEALADLNKVLEISPENELAYFNRSIVYSKMNKDQKALDDLQYILRKKPANIFVHFNMGISYARMGNVSRAFESFSKAIEIYPEYADAYLQRSLIRNSVGDTDGGISDMERYEELKEKVQLKDDMEKYREGIEVLKLTQLSNDFIQEEEKKHKVQYLDTDIDLRPPYQVDIDSAFIWQNFNKKDPIPFVLQPVALNNDRNIERVSFILSQIAVLDSLISADHDLVDYYLKRGMLFLLIHNADAAARDFSNAQALQPQNAMIYFLRGNAQMAILDKIATRASYNQDKRFNESPETFRIYSDIIHDYLKALSLDPKFLYARYNLAYARLMMHDFEGAYDDYFLATRERKIPEAHFNKALLMLYLEEDEQACNELSIAGELGIKEAYSVIRKYCN